MYYNQDNKKTGQGPIRYEQVFPGFPPGSGPGQRPGTGTGQQPGMGPGQRPGTGTGQQPGPGPGQRPGTGTGQQPGMGPGQRPPGMGPGFGPGPVRPGVQPPSSPPDFTPQLPREEQQLLSEPSGFRGPFGSRIIDFRRRPRDFGRCLNRFTYIWMVNGNNFWFYPVSIGRNSIEGFRWRRNRWDYDRLNINRILFHLCF
ncbi:hypothetical protein [Herbinix hemicellulosilytica]|uniref:hypothetical protein n=1 Tax=Herbinix hemicellulosilytica TaxID=1564487 RepID=UPI000CD14D92|nr:hypothetical protein [Herbinix hemicellulosilytica]